MGLGLLAGLGKALMTGGKLTGLGSIVGQGAFGLGADMITNRGALRRQRLADQQNIRFWKMQNEYNLPKNQMKRLQDAGLNPNLIYGSGSANTGIAGGVAPSKPAPFNVKNPVPLQSMLLASQIKNIEADTSKKDAEKDKILGLTPELVRGAKSQSDILAQKALQENVKTGEITQQQKSITESLMEKARIDIANRKYQEALTTFRLGLIKMGIDPTGNLKNTMLRWITNKINNAKKDDYLTNPQEQTWVDKQLKKLIG